MTAAYSQLLSLADAIEMCTPMKNRRREVRRRPSDLRGFLGARLRYGPEVRVIDISANGILIRTERSLPVGETVVFEFTGAERSTLVLGRVLRWRRVTSGNEAWYEVACRFKRPIAFPGLVAEIRTRASATAKVVNLKRAAAGSRATAGSRAAAGTRAAGARALRAR